MADFDARGFAAHGVGEEGGDVVAVLGDALYVVLQFGLFAHIRFRVFSL